MSGVGQGREKVAVVATVVASLGLAAWVRLARMSEVTFAGGILPLDGDSAYHMRRISLTLADYPHVPVFDPWMSWPAGGACPWAPGFDLLVATLAWGAPEAIRPIVVAASPVLLGVAAVWVGLLTARRLGAGVPTLITAGLYLALIPQFAAMSRFARVDHHVLEALLMGALGLWVLHPTRPSWRWELVGALLIAAGLLSFTGSTLYVAVTLAMLAVRRWCGGLARFAGLPATLGGAFLAALVVPSQVAGHGHAWSYAFPSWLQPALVACGAVGLLFVECSLAGGGVLRMFLGAGAAIILGSVVLGGGQLHEGLMGWLLRQDVWLGSISEFRPVYQSGWIAGTEDLWGWLGPVSPLVVVAGLLALLRRDRERALAFGVGTLALGGLAVWQCRFGRIFALDLAVMAAFALDAVCERLGTRPLQGLLAFCLVLADSGTRGMLPVSGPVELPAVPEALLALVKRPGKVDPGVLAPWDYGHSILWLGQRPVVSTGFGTVLGGPGFDEEHAAWRLPEDALIAWMKVRRLGLVLGGAALFLDRPGPNGGSVLAHRGPEAVLNLEYLRNVPLARSLVAGSGIASAGIPHLRHFAPFIATVSPLHAQGLNLAGVWILERVEGAVLRGRARPGARVVAKVSIQLAQGVLAWEAWTDAASDGTFVLTDPMANGWNGPGFQTGLVTTIVRGLTETGLSVARDEVRAGTILDVPDATADAKPGAPPP